MKKNEKKRQSVLLNYNGLNTLMFALDTLSPTNKYLKATLDKRFWVWYNIIRQSV